MAIVNNSNPNRGESKERDREHGEARGHDLAGPGPWHRVSVANGGHSDLEWERVSDPENLI